MEALLAHSPVEALWSSMQPKDEARLLGKAVLLPLAGHSPLLLLTLRSVLLHSWKDAALAQAVFCIDLRCPGHQALSGDSLLTGLCRRVRPL